MYFFLEKILKYFSMNHLNLILTLTTFLSPALAWDDLDHQIFKVNDKLALLYPDSKPPNFFAFLEVPHGATLAEVTKAFRRESMSAHPY